MNEPCVQPGGDAQPTMRRCGRHQDSNHEERTEVHARRVTQRRAYSERASARRPLLLIARSDTPPPRSLGCSWRGAEQRADTNTASRPDCKVACEAALMAAAAGAGWHMARPGSGGRWTTGCDPGYKVRATENNGCTNVALRRRMAPDRTGSLRLGAGRSQVQILSPRSGESAAKQRFRSLSSGLGLRKRVCDHPIGARVCGRRRRCSDGRLRNGYNEAEQLLHSLRATGTDPGDYCGATATIRGVANGGSLASSRFVRAPSLRVSGAPLCWGGSVAAGEAWSPRRSDAFASSSHVTRSPRNPGRLKSQQVRSVAPPQASRVRRRSNSIEVEVSEVNDRARCGHPQALAHNRGGLGNDRAS